MMMKSKMSITHICISYRETVNSHDVDGEIKSQMIQWCVFLRLSRKGLVTADISLQQLLDDARALEISEVQACGIEVNTVNSLSNQRGSKEYRKNLNPRSKAIQGNQKSCYSCGGRWANGGTSSASNRLCHNCGKLSHFRKWCRSQKPY